MKVVFILGNGFDLNLGLDTSYESFFEYYKSQDSSGSNDITSFKSIVDASYKNWSEFESALGDYMQHLKSPEQVKTIYFDLSEKLKDYLLLQEEKIVAENYSRDTLVKDLCNPTRYLNNKENIDFGRWSSKISEGENTDIHVLTFNYTRTLEIIADDIIDKGISNKPNSKQNIYRGVHHIHQSLAENPILGVNDVDEINNKNLAQSLDVKEILSKPAHNRALGHTNDEACDRIIRTANLIVVFGSSLGTTDRVWWEKIGARIDENHRLLIVAPGSEESVQQPILKSSEKRELIEHFLSVAFDGQDSNVVFSKAKYIHVALTRELFMLKNPD